MSLSFCALQRLCFALGIEGGEAVGGADLGSTMSMVKSVPLYVTGCPLVQSVT